MTIDFDAWTKATGDLKWGVQRVFIETLKAVEAEQTTLAYGADYKNGNPCLVNAVATMLNAANGMGGPSIPSTHFGAVVSQFDRLNSAFCEHGINSTPGVVSPLAAEILLKHFGPLKEPKLNEQVNDAMSNETFANAIYVEPSDEDMARDFLTALSDKCPPTGEVEPIVIDDAALEAFLTDAQ